MNFMYGPDFIEILLENEYGVIHKPRSHLRGRGVPQKTTTLHNSYLVKVATLGGRGSKF